MALVRFPRARRFVRRLAHETPNGELPRNGSTLRVDLGQVNFLNFLATEPSSDTPVAAPCEFNQKHRESRKTVNIKIGAPQGLLRMPNLPWATLALGRAKL